MSYDFIIRILAAAIIGGVIGIEREYRAKEAGFRTHFLVALGSALFMVVSQFGFEQTGGTVGNISIDPSRIASQVVTGIGFIGGGIIIFQKQIRAYVSVGKQAVQYFIVEGACLYVGMHNHFGGEILNNHWIAKNLRGNIQQFTDLDVVQHSMADDQFCVCHPF